MTDSGYEKMSCSYPELKKSLFQDVAETKQISIAAYHSCRKEGEIVMVKVA